MLRKHKIAIFFSILALVVIAIGAGMNISLRRELAESQRKLPAPIKHAEIVKQPIETFAQSLTTKIPNDLSTYADSSCASLSSDWVAAENKKPGINQTLKDWHALDVANPKGSALWLDQSSVSCGQAVGIHASTHLPTEAPAGPRTFEVLRVGWYGGSGARLVWKSQPIKLKNQKVPTLTSAERMVETKWKTTLNFTVGKDWTPGFYLVASISPLGVIESVAPLIVRSPIGSSKLVLVHSTLTWAAYNSFGGWSLYLGPGGSVATKRIERSRIVSMDRPIDGSGAMHLDRDGITFVQYLEKEGLNVDQISDVDLDQWPSISTHYNGVVFGGHAEYFTRRMFDTVIGDRNIGINLAFFGANNAYWQTRLAGSPTGPNRRVIVYRSTTEDPITAFNQVTVEFQDPHVNTPPNLITGTLKSAVHVYGNIKALNVPAWLKIAPKSQIKGISGDTEIDARAMNAAQPSNVNVLFTGKLDFRDPGVSTGEEKTKYEVTPVQETVWFTTPSGAAVFNAGLTTWPCNLLPSCITHSVGAPTQAILQSVTKQVLTLWQKRAVGLTLK